ncbi:Thiopurine S-methyltransferase (TPMT) [Belliella baltica DSM 15883]|uniref:Thiopurine S-methyltransferase (TPMT) n=1 Tax=Belliella baltica (strain DSM 15883 / CIP 108006 / LMG 21964 / BA134) TaxID=866536 RepID=I3Z8U5_BELBD|nr:SAM-dependent methyltransferase [Belliella baltica]AFL85663.1 Thiopurine S-methyltransferase (TPMT) [Belliella baltica DSM 15883]
MTLSLNEQYWTSRYKQNLIGWDVGQVTFPIKQFLDQLVNKDLRVLIPGAGNAYEAAYAYASGFKNLHILDISKVPLDNFLEKYPDFPKSQVHHENFFDHQGKYDLILEQTFFCALPVELRKDYADKIHELLVQDGQLAGVLFNREFGNDNPPFGGSVEEYRSYFSNLFEIKKMEPCYNSIPPRLGSEVFIKIIKK